MKTRQIRAIMVARVAMASTVMLHRRQNAFKRKHAEFRALHASGAQKHLLEHVMAELEAMAHPIHDTYTLHPVGWVRKQRPKTKEQAWKWVSAVRRGLLPVGAHIFAKPGSGLLLTGALVGIMFTE